MNRSETPGVLRELQDCHPKLCSPHCPAKRAGQARSRRVRQTRDEAPSQSSGHAARAPLAHRARKRSQPPARVDARICQCTSSSRRPRARTSPRP
jgi:hypothetical protein